MLLPGFGQGHFHLRIFHDNAEIQGSQQLNIGDSGFIRRNFFLRLAKPWFVGWPSSQQCELSKVFNGFLAEHLFALRGQTNTKAKAFGTLMAPRAQP